MNAKLDARAEQRKAVSDWAALRVWAAEVRDWAKALIAVLDTEDRCRNRPSARAGLTATAEQLRQRLLSKLGDAPKVSDASTR